MRNAEIAAALRELGTLYELDGADRFRVGAYKDAAKVAADSPVSLEQLSAEGRLTELPGFGKTLAHNLALLRHLPETSVDGLPVLAGLSRKSMLGAITGRPVEERLPASLAAAGSGGEGGEGSESHASAAHSPFSSNCINTMLTKVGTEGLAASTV